MKKTVLFIFSIVLATAGMVTAQPEGGRSGGMEIRTYFQEKIKPELKKQHDRFLAALSGTEKAELEKIKAEREKVRSAMQGKTMPADRKPTREAHFAGFKTRIDKIVDAHPDLRDAYIKEMSAKKNQWQQDLTAIKEKNGMPANNMQGKMILDKVDDPAFILIYDPYHDDAKINTKRHQAAKHRKAIMTKQGQPAEPAIKVFPKPAKATVTVKVMGVKNKPVKAAVFNAKGKKVKTLFDAISSIPVLSFSFDISKWENGIYTVKVQYGEMGMSRDFKIEK